MRRTDLVFLAVMMLILQGGAAVGIAQSNGIASKRPVFGGACPACPWGAMADVVKAAMKPYGYDVQNCYYCAGSARAARLIAAATCWGALRTEYGVCAKAGKAADYNVNSY